MSSKLEYRPIAHGVEIAKRAIKQRRDGEVKSLLTSKQKFNSYLMNGIDWNRIISFAGMSGSGKSTLLEELKRDIIDLNRDQKFYILSFEFEMLIEDQLTKGVSSKLDKTIKELYSADQPLGEEDYEQAIKYLDQVKNDPVFYVDNAGTVNEIVATIWDFAARYCDPSTGLVITLDHVLLTKGKQTDDEKAIVDHLMREFVAIKKQFASKNMKIIFVVLSQMNRDIEKSERTQNFYLHYPTRNDIFASSAVYTCSDYVVITHRPSALTGIGERYGPPVKGYPNGLPVKCPTDPTKKMVYWHIIKERFGDTKIISLVENFKYGKLTEYTL